MLAGGAKDRLSNGSRNHRIIERDGKLDTCIKQIVEIRGKAVRTA